MVVPVRKLMEVIRFFLVFITCSLLCYGIITLLTEVFLPTNPYQEPHGNAIKVGKLLDGTASHEVDWYVERLQLYYLVGE